MKKNNSMSNFYNDFEQKKLEAESWFNDLRNQICLNFESIEKDSVKDSNKKPANFEVKLWDRPGGGGGKMSIMKGKIFEKVGVNVSSVHGILSECFRENIPGASKTGEFWASGISVVAHPRNPHIPAAHMNTRLISTSKSWFGGGGDITPMVPSPLMSKFFHSEFQKTCEAHDENYYKKFKSWADEYFFIKHREEARGDGGIFFDNLNSGNWEKDFSFIKDVGKTFHGVYSNIVNQTKEIIWNDVDRENQLKKRGRYAEFNLVYDRGTLFGLKTGGNVEAVLMSMPPEVKWS